MSLIKGNLEADAVQTTGRKHRGHSERLGVDKDFLEKTPEAQAIKSKINKWDHIQLKSFYTTLKTINKVKM